ncbi:MAG: hypothetical protein B7Z59_08820 [Acidiphilium sp. 37-67-22]|jgi:hypothetical protein|uniref:hypothetical protein n=1 Tax=unclassified Acidiphilium TaxID=2617493 RepID=UPI000BD80407|nr:MULTISPECIES: hypothetical protein [unclassified Acidiphilium]OYV56481.1 MAG: hypothetical protein B7Z76_06130 [Acidiphilium sp. 20-67-58]OYW09077.1 MAG: hypothetical protein B7Z59_08820 [Acidiphilium sp. 37-67-22]HQT59835.1 hypothetical protein [Acidiphilium sp.]HQU10403.1 hypothetical protein [Acidiphilium sp.]
MGEDTIAFLRDALGDLRSDVGMLQVEIASGRRDIAAIEARHLALEAWRNRFELQVTGTQERFIDRSDELVEAFAQFRSELARFRGEQSGSHRVIMVVIGVISAVIGSVADHWLRFGG